MMETSYGIFPHSVALSTGGGIQAMHSIDYHGTYSRHLQTNRNTMDEEEDIKKTVSEECDG